MSTITFPLTITLSPEAKALLAALRGLDPYAGLPITTKAEAPTALTQPAPGEYWPGQGGRYICTLPALMGLPARHLIAGPECAEQLTFGPCDEVAGADSHIDGRANTAALLAAGGEHSAAKWASTCTADDHADYFLPSRLDLFMAFICARQLFNPSGFYWTSTQHSRYGAFVQVFEDGYSGWDGKGSQRMVRAFRWIQAT